MGIYDYEVKTTSGDSIQLEQFAGKVVLVVNTASKCGFTPQYKELQALYEKYKEEDFVVLGFPSNQFMNQEPGSNDEIQSFCEINYGVTFPIFEKTDVNGPNAHPLFNYLVNESKGFLGTKSIKWNFTKFLIDKNGNVIKRFSPNTNPSSIEPEIKKLLDA